jgi:hypothetical protein
VGCYTTGTKTFEVRATGEGLILLYGGETVRLERREPDAFYAAHPDFALFLLRFGRESSEVVEAVHGLDWYRNERYSGLSNFEYPPDWDAYVGHYRAHNPWRPGFRVFVRKRALWLGEAAGLEEQLVALDGNRFRVREDDYSPERLRFDTAIGGQMQRATLSGSAYYRFFRP